MNSVNIFAQAGWALDGFLDGFLVGFLDDFPATI